MPKSQNSSYKSIRYGSCNNTANNTIFVGKVSRLFGNIPDGLESFQTVRKVTRRSGKLYVAKALSSLLAHICRKSDLRTFGAYMSRKRFTHSIQKVLAREFLPTEKFWLFVSLKKHRYYSPGYPTCYNDTQIQHLANPRIPHKCYSFGDTSLWCVTIWTKFQCSLHQHDRERSVESFWALALNQVNICCCF